MTKVFPIKATVARTEYVVRVKVVIPGGGWFGAVVDALEMFIVAEQLMKTSTALF